MPIRPFALAAILMAIDYSAGAAESATGANLPSSATPSAQVTIHAGAPGHVMAGGIGASWHAIREPTKRDPAYGKYDLQLPAPEGSALQGNPPLAATAAWQDIERHASWLGLDWLRVEVERRMYEPERGKYDWDNEESHTMFRILDWCQRNDADVFLTEMWRNVKWLAIPGVHPLRSAPNDAAGFAEGLATLSEQLVRERKYSCVKWLCLANEWNMSAFWWEGGGKAVSMKDMAAAVRAELDRRGIALPISGPDYNYIPKNVSGMEELAPSYGAIDLHDYGGPRNQGLQSWAQWSHEQKRPFFLSEFGDMGLGWKDAHPGPASFEASLSNAEKVLHGLNIAIDGFNRWSFVNRGDLDGQWQLVRTWDMKNKVFYDRVAPEPAAYYGFAMLTRFTAKHSRVLDLDMTTSEGSGKVPRFNVAALRSPKGQTTCIILNREPQDRAIDLGWEGLDRSLHLHRYELTEPMLADPAFKLRSNAQSDLSPEQSHLQMTVPGRSITVYTTYDLGPDDPGVIAEAPAAP